MSRMFVVLLLFLPVLNAAAAAQDAAPELLPVKRIWNQGGHIAFTGLVRFEGRWYCTFREAEGHVKGDGKLRVIFSEDGEYWTSVALIEESGTDLRNPKLSVTPDSRLMLLAGDSIYRDGELKGVQPRAICPSGGDCSYPRMVWHDGLLWVSYYASHEDTTSIYLAKIRVPLQETAP